MFYFIRVLPWKIASTLSPCFTIIVALGYGVTSLMQSLILMENGAKALTAMCSTGQEAPMQGCSMALQSNWPSLRQGPARVVLGPAKVVLDPARVV